MTKTININNTQLLLIIGGAVVLYVLYKQGTFKTDKGYQTDIKTNVTDNSTVQIDDSTAKNRARSFRNNLLDNNTDSSIFIDACDSLLRLSDADLIAVSNAYNKMFVNEDYNTLRSVLVQEWTIWGSSQTKKNELLNRFSKIGI
jgi:hypothetical protein